MFLSEQLLCKFKDSYKIPPLLLSECIKREVFPQWMNLQNKDWLALLHKKVTSKRWPKELKSACAVLAKLNLECLGNVMICDQAKLIFMPICTPAYLKSLFDIISLADKMLFNKNMIRDSILQLAQLSGMLKETNYCDTSGEYWCGATIFGARFLYYHELGHLSIQESPKWILQGEEHLVDELLADQFALAMIVAELKKQKDLQPIGFVGVVLAIAFVALKEFSNGPDDKKITKNATLRMFRLFYWGKIFISCGLLSQESIEIGKIFWECFVTLLHEIDNIPSPIYSLLSQTTNRPFSEWTIASNNILKWCVFGERAKVISTIKDIRDAAKNETSNQLKACKVLSVIDFLLSDTADCEPTLGMKEVLE